MHIMVTGSEGFVGKATSKFLEDKGHTINRFDILNGHDLLDLAILNKSIWRMDVVLHLAGIIRFEEAEDNPKKTYEVNVKGTENLVKACKFRNIPLVFASTGSVYMPIDREMPITEDFPVRGNSLYGCSKIVAEKYIEELDKYIILRYGYLYGKEKGEHGLFGHFMRNINDGKAPVLYGGEQTNDFCYIDDIVQANYLALTSKNGWNQIYNIGSGEETTARKAGELFCEAIGYKGDIEVIKSREVDSKRFVYDVSKAEKLLGYNPKYNLKEGLKKLCEE